MWISSQLPLPPLFGHTGVDLLRCLCPSRNVSLGGLFCVLSVLYNVLDRASLSLPWLEELPLPLPERCLKTSPLFGSHLTSIQSEISSEHLCRTADNCGSCLPLVDLFGRVVQRKSSLMRLSPKVCCLGEQIVLVNNIDLLTSF